MDGRTPRAMLIDNSSLTGTPLAPPRRIKVAICVPSMDRVHADFMTSLTGMMATSVTRISVDCYMINHQNSVIADARNNLTKIALEWGADCLLWIDSDLQFPNDTLIRLLQHDLDIVGSTYCQRAHPYAVMGKFLGEPKEDLSEEKLVETDYLPGGLMLVRASVYKAVKGPWYEDFYNLETQNLIDAVRKWSISSSAVRYKENALKKAFAAYEASDPMQRLGEDVDFCHKAAREGFKIWCDLDLTDQVTHIGQVHVRARLPGRAPVGGANIFIPSAAQ